MKKSCNFAPLSKTTKERCRSGRSGRSRKPLYPLGTQGSNPCLSANIQAKTAASQQLAAVLILYTYKNTYKLPDNPSPIQMRLYHGKSKEGKIIL